MAVLSERANGREINVSRGETLEVRLQERPTTGFRWQIVAGGTPICVLVHDSFIPPSERVPGRAGRHSWTFRVEHSGRATIELASRRQWEQKAVPAKTFRITVIAAD